MTISENTPQARPVVAPDTVESLQEQIRKTIRYLASLQERLDRLLPERSYPGPKIGSKTLLGRQPFCPRELSPGEKVVFDLFRGSPDIRWTSAEIIKKTGAHQTTCNIALSNLAKDGYITRVKRGVYEFNRPKKTNDD